MRKIYRQCFVPMMGVFLLFAAPAVSHASTYNLTSDFSTAVNPNGAWSYGYETSLNGSFALYDTILNWAGGASWYSSTHHSSDTTPSIWIATASQNGVAAGETAFHPGYDGSFSVVRWTAPMSGQFHVTGTFGAGDSGAMSYYTAFNGSSVDQQANDPNSYNFDFTENVGAGSTIDFIVGVNTGSGYAYGSTPISASIASVGTTPLPSSWTMMLAGLAGFGFVAYPRRKRRGLFAAI